MGIVVVIIIIAFFVGLIFVSAKMNNLKYRAGQQMLKNTGFSSSEINAGISGAFEKKYIQKFLEQNSNYTEESIKDLLKQYSDKIIAREPVNEFGSKVNEKIQKDSKINQMQNMEFSRININYYGHSRLNAIVVYTDNRDEYNIYLNCSLVDSTIKLDGYQIVRGSVVGL